MHSPAKGAGSRAQAIIKLYVIYNVLEICDRMCCFVGPDVLDAVFHSSSTTLDRVPAASETPSGGGGGGERRLSERVRQLLGEWAPGVTLWSAERQSVRVATDLTVAAVYVSTHALVLLWQAVTLQVATPSSRPKLRA